MTVIAMSTSGGPHPPEMWAEVALRDLIHVAPGYHGAGLHLRDRFKTILAEHLRAAQRYERDQLEDDDDRLMSDLYESAQVTAAVNDLLAEAKSSEFAEHYARPEVQERLHRVLRDAFANVKHVERSWFVDRHPDHPSAPEFCRRYRGAE